MSNLFWLVDKLFDALLEYLIIPTAYINTRLYNIAMKIF